MSFFLLFNLLIGKMPDALGLMVFGFVMILTSILLRRVVGDDNAMEHDEAAIEEVI